MTHLTPEQLIDVLERSGATTHRSLGEAGHLAECERCRRALADLAAVLADAQQVSVPEPSPLFWPHFSERVRAAIDREAPPTGAWRSWLRWQVLLPFGAAASIILAAMFFLARPDRAAGDAAAAPPDAPAAFEALASSDSWVVLADLVGEMDLDAATAAGVIAPGVAEQAVLQLTADEQQELTRLLEAELTRAKS